MACLYRRWGLTDYGALGRDSRILLVLLIVELVETRGDIPLL